MSDLNPDQLGLLVSLTPAAKVLMAEPGGPVSRVDQDLAREMLLGDIGDIEDALGPSVHIQGGFVPSDTVDIPGGPYRLVYVGTTAGGNDAVVTIMAQDGSIAPVVVGQGEAIRGVSIKRVMDTGTDAGVADLVAW